LAAPSAKLRLIDELLDLQSEILVAAPGFGGGELQCDGVKTLVVTCAVTLKESFDLGGCGHRIRDGFLPEDRSTRRCSATEQISRAPVSSTLLESFATVASDIYRAEHFVKVSGNLPGEISLDLVDIAELGKGPAAMGANMVHSGHPVGVHGLGFHLGILSPVAFDLYDEMEEILLAPPVIDQDNEVGTIFPRISDP
jgi:hypothetical protein